MKTALRLLFACAFLAAAAAAYSSAPGVQVTVKSKTGGKAMYKGVTDQSGNFATNALQPGTYSVEFRGSQFGGKQLSISLSAAKGATRQAAADGNHLKGGVAIEVEVPAASKLTGTVSVGGKAASQANAPVPAGMEKVKANVKVINGKRYVWVPAPIGSNMGGKWALEGSDEAALSTSNRKGGDSEVVRRVQDQAGNVGQRGDQ